MKARRREPGDEILGHPKGLPVLVSLKVWELFSYQGMRAFLIFYLIAAFGLSDARAAVIFGSYAALVLATSVLGGGVADRWLGQREPVISGAILIMGGHTTLALQHLGVGLGLLRGPLVFQIFCLALAMIAVGTGMLKPNVLNLIGGLYRRSEARRETGFYLYYLGVNIGSLVAPITCGWLAQAYGWTWGFGAAAVGMGAGLSILLWGRRHIRRADGDRAVLEGRVSPPRLRIYTLVGGAVVAAAFLIQHGLMLGALLAVTLAAGVAYLLVVAARDATGGDRKAALRLIGVLPAPFMFVVVFEQFSLSINLFADRLVDRSLFGLTVAAPQLLALNSAFVLLLLPLLTLLWSLLRGMGREPDITRKFAMGFLSMAAGFALLAGAIALHPAGGKVGMAWVAGTYLLITLGELLIAPLTYALVGRTAPPHMEGVGMGLLLLSFALGNLSAGLLATGAAVPVGASLVRASGVYGRYFLLVMGLALAASAASLALRRIVSPAGAPQA